MEKYKDLIFLSAELPGDIPAGGPRPVPEEVLLFAYGDTQYERGGKEGKYKFLEADADRLITDFVRGGVDIPVDYNHQQLRAKDNGKPAPAAGWITALEKGPAGLMCKVKWTDAAAAMIAAREYRYTSPSFYQTKDGKVAALYNLSLTNNPATLGCHALVAAEDDANIDINNNQGGRMEGILTLLGLSADAPESVIHNKVKPLLDIDAAAQKLIDALREPLALSSDDASTPDQLNTVTGLVLALAERAKDGDAAKTRLVELERGMLDAKISDALNKRLLTNAQLEWAKELSLVQLEKFLEKASPVVPESSAPTAPVRTAENAETATAATIRARFGHSAADLAKYNKNKEA